MHVIQDYLLVQSEHRHNTNIGCDMGNFMQGVYNYNAWLLGECNYKSVGKL